MEIVGIAGFPSFRSRLVIVTSGAALLAAGAVLFCAGYRHVTTPALAAGPPRHAPPSPAGVQASPQYRLAAADFKGNDIAAALRRVDALLARTDLTVADRNFLTRQQAICEARISGKTPVLPQQARNTTSHSPRPTAEQSDCGPRALLIACRQMNVPAALVPLRKAAGTTDLGTNLAGLIAAAKTVGVTARGVQMDGPALANLDTRKEPALAWVDGGHYITVLSIHGDSATIHDPNHTGDEDIALTSGPTSLLARSGGILLLLSPGASKAGNPAAGI